MRFSEYMMLAVIVILIILLGVSQIRPPEFRTIVYHDTIIARDTITITQKAKLKYKIRELRDTVVLYDSTSFVACIDTVVKKTDVLVCYEHPQSIFQIHIRSHPDTIQNVTVVEKPIFKYEPKKDPWYHDAMKIGAGVVLGFLVGRAK